jgi:hypothetical protein
VLYKWCPVSVQSVSVLFAGDECRVVVLEKKAGIYQLVLYINFCILVTDLMKKTWLILPGYCVGLGGLLLITYRTLLAVSSPGKVVMVSVNRFGEQYLDLVCLVFLWAVCLIGLLSLSSMVSEKKREGWSTVEHSKKDVLVNPIFSNSVSDSFTQRSALILMKDSPEGFFTTDAASLSIDDVSCSVSVSVVVQQEGSQE